jgi:hypothetical protein
MKVVASNNTVVNSPNFVSANFTIRQKNLSKIINIVENDIYSDKILAVIREYSCNAYDANVQSGKHNVPITVSLPSSLNSQFKVRDYGNGLTEDEINRVYTSYGESTKEDSNDYIGQLGIGSKSGFAYGENFIVTSWKNRVKTVYNAIKGSDSREMVKLYSESSDEPSGIEVTIPVKIGDESLFKNKSLEFFKYWDVCPTIVGATDQEIEEIINFNDIKNTIIGGEDWKIVARINSHSKKSIALMGNIPYPIEWSMIIESFKKINNFDNDYINNFIKFFQRNNLVIRFKIGDIQMAPSREVLQYTEHTVNNILKKINYVCDNLEKKIIEQISDSKTLWDFKSKINYLFGSTRGFTQLEFTNFIYNRIKPKLMFNGVNVSSAEYEEDCLSWDSNLGKVSKSFDRGNNLTPLVSLYHLPPYGINNNGLKQIKSFKLVADRNHHILVMDVNRKTYTKQCFKWHLDTNKVSRLYVLNFGNDDVKSKFYKTYDISGATVVNFSEVFSKFKHLIPKRNKSPKLNHNTIKCGALVPTNYFNVYSRKRTEDIWEYYQEIDLDKESGYYLDTSGGDNMTFGGIVMKHSKFIYLLQRLHDAKIVDISSLGTIYGFGRRVMKSKQFNRNKHNWINVINYIEKMVSNSLNSDITNKLVVRSTIMERVQNKDINNFFIHKKFLESIVCELPDTHSLNIAYKNYPDSGDYINHDVMNCINYLKNLGLDIFNKNAKKTIKIDVENYFNSIASKYPMLKTLMFTHNYSLDSRCDAGVLKEIVNYINLVDNTQTVV